MIRVVVEAVTYHLTVNVGATRFRVFILFEDQAGRALPHNESIPIAIKRPASNYTAAPAHGWGETEARCLPGRVWPNRRQIVHTDPTASAAATERILPVPSH